MVEKVKKYAMEEMKNIDRGYEPNACLSRAYGAVMFVLNYNDNGYDKELAEWWENEILAKFYQRMLGRA